VDKFANSTLCRDLNQQLVCRGWGVDDTNMKRLAPYLALYGTSCPWVMPAVRANVTFNNANWRFRFAQGAGLSNVAKAQLDVNPYARRAVTNDIVQDGGGTDRARSADDADAGCAD
jgi:hypothetical protein